MIFQKFTLLSKKLATLEDSGTGFGRFNLVLILVTLTNKCCLLFDSMPQKMSVSFYRLLR